MDASPWPLPPGTLVWSVHLIETEHGVDVREEQHRIRSHFVDDYGSLCYSTDMLRTGWTVPIFAGRISRIIRVERTSTA